MKKMLIGAFAGAFALCAQAEITTVSVADASLPTGTSFENYNPGNPGTPGTPGTVIDLAKDDGGGNSGSFWCTNGNSEVTFVVSNLTDYAAYDKSCGRPAIAGTPNEKYVKIEADSRVYRTVQAGAVVDENGDFTTVEQVSFSNDAPLFFDSMVLFTATDEFKMPEYSQGDKLVVWLYGEEPNGEDESVATSTNLVITAGYLDAQGIPTPTNYVVSSESLAIEPNTWHRLTIKALRSDKFKIGGTDDLLEAKVSGFQVWVDGTKVSASAGSDQAISLFPSLVKSLETDSDDTKSIAGVAFKGTGAVDDISFTATAPDFAQEQIAQEFTLGATLDDDEGLVDTVAYSVDGGTETTVYDVYNSIDNLATEAIAVGGTTLTLTVTLSEEANVAFIEDNGATTNLWTDAGNNTFTTNISISAQTAGSSLGLTIAAFYSDGGDEPTPDPDPTKADDGSGNSFTVDAAVVTTLEGLGAVAEEGKTLLNSRQVKSTDPDTGAKTYSTLTYGQAYALGVLDENGNIGDVPAVTISFDTDGRPVVKMDDTNANTTDYTITCTLVYKEDLGVTGDFAGFDPAVTAGIGENLTDATASKPDKRFYQVKVSITD